MAQKNYKEKMAKWLQDENSARPCKVFQFSVKKI